MSNKNKKSGGIFTTIIMTVLVLGMIAAAILYSNHYTVDAGEKAVVTRFGEIVRVENEGLRFTVPLIETARIVSIRTNVKTYDEHRLYSSDNLPATATVVVQFNVSDPALIYKKYKTYDIAVSNAIDVLVPSGVKAVFGSTSAENNVQGRDELNHAMLLYIQEQMKNNNEPFVVTALEIRDVDFGDKFNTANQDRIVSQFQRDIATNLAEATKTSADATQYRAGKLAEVFGNDNAASYMTNENSVNRWDGRLSNTLVIGGDNGVTPMLGVGKNVVSPSN